jgi:hemolysin activation/secretion protein
MDRETNIAIRSAKVGLLISTVAVSQMAMSQPAALAPTREELQRTLPTAPPPTARIEVEGGLERPPCALDNPEFAEVRFVLRGVTFSGIDTIDPSIVRPAYANLVGSEQKVSAICDVRDRAADLLRSAGYIVAIKVPEQSVADGNLRLDVVLARLTEVRVRGDAGRAEKLIASYLNQLTQRPVFNKYEAERYLLLASDLPGYSARLALRPAGSEPGAVVGEVTVARQQFAADANIQNYGSKELGRVGGQLRTQFFGITGLGDVTTLSYFMTAQPREQKTLQAAHDFRIGGEGLTVLSSLGYTWARPDIPGRDTIRARSLIGSLALAYPFVRRQNSNLRGTAGLDFINQVVRQSGDAINRDRLRILFARIDWDALSMDFSKPGFSFLEPRWRVGASLEGRHGIDIFNATNKCGTSCVVSGGIPLSRDGADPTAGVVRASAFGEFRPLPTITFSANLRAQYSTKTLASFEQFAAGNYTAGRGYDPGALLGDRGIGGQFEIRGGSIVPQSARKPAFQPFVFFDAAKVGNEEGSFLPRGQRSLYSVGGGLRANWYGFGIDTAFAVPLKKTGFADDKPDPRLLFSISRRLLPWN